MLQAEDFSPLGTVTITKYETQKSYRDNLLHRWPQEANHVVKLEVTFEDFGPRMPTDQANRIPLRRGSEDLHRKMELRQGEYRPTGRIGDRNAYHIVHWNKI